MVIAQALWLLCDLYSRLLNMDAQLTAPYSRSIPVRATICFFAAALFTSAYLLFWLQPLIGKMLLPLLGGAPSVWNTCMVFFQTLLLGGYAYALFISQRLRLKTQAILHISLVLCAGLFLPFAISGRLIGSLPAQDNPTLWLLGVLLITVGFPFFVLSATAPLLQRWFSHSSHRSAEDPYFLYAVSNAGSMLSLLAFPFLLEPTFNLQSQSHYWSLGYALLAVLLCGCALLVKENEAGREDTKSVTSETRPTMRVRFEWIILAFIPSSLMLGVTTYISTDVASMPLIWIMPLALYLLTFILAFAKRQLISLRMAALLLPPLITFLAYVVVLKPLVSAWNLIFLHLAVFFVISFICHRRIALARPSVSKLAEYYLCISVGGVLGGIANALLAPKLFSTTLEYPIVILIACLMLPIASKVSGSKSVMTFGFPTGLFLLTFGLGFFVPKLSSNQRLSDLMVLCLPLLLCYLVAARRRYIFALSLLAVTVGGYSYLNANEHVLTTQRNFFGVWRVSSERSRENEVFHRLKHGSTMHGWQYTDPLRKCQATSYYHKDGPLGQVFDIYDENPSSKHVAVAGLGAGTVATYSRTGEQWDFYEIDPTIVRIARDDRYFTFLGDCSTAPFRMVMGDARLRLVEAPVSHYGLIILDAFSSDSVPAHLVTSQALDLYLSKLAPNGVIVFHISNRYLDLEPLLSGLSQQHRLSARIRKDSEANVAVGKYASIWVAMARSEADLGGIVTDSRWRPLTGNVVWSDDFSNILGLMK